MGKKGLTRDGNYFCISNFLYDELNTLGIPPMILAEAVNDFLREGTASYSVYWGSSQERGNTRVLNLLITTPNKSKRVFLMVSNFDGIYEITLLEPFNFGNSMEKLISYGKNLEKYEVSMPFLYKFVVFETFDAFKKLSRVEFQGIISKDTEKYMVAMGNEKALLWKIETPRVDLVNKENVRLTNLNH